MNKSKCTNCLVDPIQIEEKCEKIFDDTIKSLNLKEINIPCQIEFMRPTIT